MIAGQMVARSAAARKLPMRVSKVIVGVPIYLVHSHSVTMVRIRGRSRTNECAVRSLLAAEPAVRQQRRNCEQAVRRNHTRTGGLARAAKNVLRRDCPA